MTAKSKKQQRYMGMLYRCKETGECPNKDISDKAKKVKKKVVRDFAETKHKGLPEKVKKRKKKRKTRKRNKKSLLILDDLILLSNSLDELNLNYDSKHLSSIITGVVSDGHKT